MNKKVKTLSRIVIAAILCFLFVNPAQVLAATYTDNLEIDVDMYTTSGQPFNEANMTANVIRHVVTNYPKPDTHNRTKLASNVPIVSDGTGNYKHTYGNVTVAATKIDEPSGVWYEDLLIRVPKYVRNVTFGPLHTYRMYIYDHTAAWTLTGIRDLDVTLSNAANRIEKVSPGVYRYVGGPTFSTYFRDYPQIEFTGVRIGLSAVHGTKGVSSSTSKAGQKISFIAQPQPVIENFIDPTGSLITPPSGFTQGNIIEVTTDQFTHTMSGTLPATYVTGGVTYSFLGWYQGATKPATLNRLNPPSISIDYSENKTDAEFEDLGKLNVVYGIAKNLTEKYVDETGASIDSGSWDPTTPIPVEENAPFQIPYTVGQTKTDSTGADWEYVGWKYLSDPASTVKTTVQTDPITTDTEVQYIFKKRLQTITEKWVDQADGTTLVSMTGNPKTSTIDDNDNFTGSASATITDSGGDTWDFVGWENVTDAPGTINPSSAYAVNNVKGSKEIRYHYQPQNTTATLDLVPTPQITASGGSVSWNSKLTNTGTSTLNNLKLKATSNWASGLTHPTQVTVTPAGGSPVNFTVSPGDWTSGFNLTGISIPSSGPNNYADITFTDTATGAVNQVLPAEIEIDGNMASPMTAENFVRIDDPDEPNLKPTGNAGLINLPDFRFGDVEVKPYAQTKGLDSSSYQAGYNPYIRYMDQESLSGWSLTTKLGQFTSGSKTLPTTTTIQLKNGDLKEVQNYNKHNESLSSISSAGNKSIPSDSTTVSLTNGGAQGIYQLDYAFNDVELDLLAHSGVAGLSYTATMDWTLTTAP